jgi:hypothetical protein
MSLVSETILVDRAAVIDTKIELYGYVIGIRNHLG